MAFDFEISFEGEGRLAYDEIFLLESTDYDSTGDYAKLYETKGLTFAGGSGIPYITYPLFYLNKSYGLSQAPLSPPPLPTSYETDDLLDLLLI